MDSEGILYVALFAAAVCGLIGATLLYSRDRAGTGFVLGFLLGPIGLIIAAMMRLEPATAPVAPAPAAGARRTAPMIECPKCGTLYHLDKTGCHSCGLAKPKIPKIIPPERAAPVAAPRTVVPAGMKKCPECAEVIQGEARKCRYCGSDVSAVPAIG